VCLRNPSKNSHLNLHTLWLLCRVVGPKIAVYRLRHPSEHKHRLPSPTMSPQWLFFSAYRQPQSRPPTNGPPDYLYQPPYDGHWPSQSQGQYAMPSNSRLPYPQPSGAGLAPSPYPFAQPSNSSYVSHSFTSDVHTPVIPQNMYYPVNTLQEASQGVHSSPSYYQRNEQPSGVVYRDPTTVPGNRWV
jgi:hypothetical protein